MYKTIEELVTRVDERNSDGTVSELIGVSIDKCFIKSVANTNGTDLSKYKIIRKNDFAVSLMQVSRDGKIPVARLEEYEEAIMSPAYPIFRVKDKNIILPDYLEMWFKRPEFDREAAFIAVGGVRGSMPWEEFAKMKLPVPSIEKQQKIVNAYKIVTDRIALKQRINDNLQQQAAAIFRSWFVDCAPFGGKAPDEWKNVTLEDITALISRGITPKYADDTDQIVINQKCIRNHTIDLSLARTHTPKVINEKWLRFGDLLINSTGDGTLGRAAQVWFQPKNLTVDSHVTIARPAKENLIFYIGLWGILHEKEIESLHTGSTGQTELPRDRVKAMELRLPDNDTLDRFNALITPMATAIVANQEENNRLAALRDAILPKLMSGEIDVSAVQL